MSNLVYDDGNYYLRCWVYNPQSGDCDARIRLKIESTGEGVQFFSTASDACSGNKWESVSGTVEPGWTGSLISAQWIVTTAYPDERAAVPDYYLFGPTCRDHSYPDGSYVLRNQLLSPKNNPSGSGTTSSDRIYFLDCENHEVYIENSRASGTLVLLNSDSTTIRKSVNFKNYVYYLTSLL